MLRDTTLAAGLTVAPGNNLPASAVWELCDGVVQTCKAAKRGLWLMQFPESQGRSPVREVGGGFVDNGFSEVFFSGIL